MNAESGPGEADRGQETTTGRTVDEGRGGGAADRRATAAQRVSSQGELSGRGRAGPGTTRGATTVRPVGAKRSGADCQWP